MKPTHPTFSPLELVNFVHGLLSDIDESVNDIFRRRSDFLVNKFLDFCAVFRIFSFNTGEKLDGIGCIFQVVQLCAGLRTGDSRHTDSSNMY